MSKKYILTSDYFKAKTDMPHSTRKMSIYKENCGKRESCLIADDRILQKGGHKLNFECTSKTMNYLFELPIVYW